MTFKVSPSTMYDTQNNKTLDGYRIAMSNKYGTDVYYISDEEAYELLAQLVWAIRNKNSSSNENQ